MGLLHTGVTFINFDETYFQQQKLHKYVHDDIDCQQLMHVNLYCEEDSLQTINNQLQTRRHKGITFIGSGNYHYVTYLLLKEITKPFTLVLFDNHPDLSMAESHGETLLSCGSWVTYALREIPLLQKVVIIGPTTLKAHFATNPRVVIFPFDGSHYYSLKSILSVIHTQVVYVSIDKDVLNSAEVVTNWDQGVMNIDTLIHYLENILRSKNVEGLDVCGEVRVSPVDTFLPEFQTIIKKNEDANIKILQTGIKMSRRQNKGA